MGTGLELLGLLLVIVIVGAVVFSKKSSNQPHTNTVSWPHREFVPDALATEVLWDER